MSLRANILRFKKGTLLVPEKNKNVEEDFKTKLDVAKSTDIHAKIQIANHIVNVCKNELEKKKKIKVDKITERLGAYTGNVDQYLLFKAKKSMKCSRSFLDWLNYLKYPDDIPATYEQFREVIYDFYINKRRIPTKADLTRTFQDQNLITHHVAVPSYLNARGFTWLPLPGTENSIIVEKPQQFSKRIKYLKAIKLFREQGRFITYIDQKNYSPRKKHMRELEKADGAYIYHVVMANRYGFMSLCNFKIVLPAEELERFEMFIKEHVLTEVPPASVIVITDKPSQNIKELNENSSRSELIFWLQENNIPHNTEMHKAELFSLMMKSKKAVEGNSCYLDEMLRGFGYEVIRRPRVMEETNFFMKYFNEINKSLTHKVCYGVCDLSAYKYYWKKEDWEMFEIELVEREHRIYEEDMKVEEIIDSLIMMAKDGKISGIDLGFDLDDDRPDDQFLSNLLIL